jgi:hypothetical protein
VNKKKLFNLRYASLRNAIERIFGKWKQRFKILRTAPEYNVKTQVQLVYALEALYNIIKTASNHDEELTDDKEGYQDAALNNSGGAQVIERAEDSAMVAKRDQIAEAMWTDYQRYIERLG